MTTPEAWLARVAELLPGTVGGDSGDLHGRYADAFPRGFIDTHRADSVPAYIAALEGYARRPVPTLQLVEPTQPSGDGAAERPHLVLLWSTPAPALLADVFPVLENLGLRVASHGAFEVLPADRAPVRVEEFSLLPRDALALLDDGIRDLVTEAFDAVWSGTAEDDELNQLVARAGLSWREVMVLRAVSAYLRQAGTLFTTAYVARTLRAHRPITRLLVDLFKARFDPRPGGEAREHQVRGLLEGELAAIDNLTDDRLLRSFLSVITGTMRTSYFQVDQRGDPKPYLVLKLEPSGFEFLPRPRPLVETFVYSSRVEGLHLRSARVARGGIRWSDRPEDYRTEVLGLMRAQLVKNAVIVPQGAKGAFVVKRPPAVTHMHALAEEVRHGYSTFVRGLLDVTDNLVDGVVVHPAATVCHDGADPYLVVAADKGTATFSDLANGIAAEHDFWLGDAFASGGATGYDHKALGVTARGMWESLRRHLGELGIDPTHDRFTVVGIGDMSGDVFGNGMLLSDRIRLVAAFDHRHIFLDPDPDSASSFSERQRLFATPGSSWADYRPELFSEGGGVYLRTATSVPLTPQVRGLLGVETDRMSADELVRAVLRAPVDVLFNGGIGTYVKASDESHGVVGDRRNQSVRVDATELRARIVAEGGNLGVTQRARVEYAVAGGKINADFIDNSAGVETSDREVNLKILLDAAIAAGRLDRARRDELLHEAAPQVVAHVLANNAAQAQSLSVSEWLGPLLLDPLADVIRLLEQRGVLDRREESLPDEEALARRRADGIGMTRPEMALLLASAKNTYSQTLLASDVPDDPGVRADTLNRYLPPSLAEFGDLMAVHPLRREIATSVLVNEMMNRLGSGLVRRVIELSGQHEPQAALGYLAGRDVLGLPAVWAEIDHLDIATHGAVQTRMLVELRTVAERSTRWFLRHRHVVDPAFEVTRLRPGVAKLVSCLPDVLPATAHARLQARIDSLVEAGAPTDLARDVCVLRRLSAALDLVEAAHDADADLPWFAEVYYGLGEHLELDWLSRRATYEPDDSHWLMLAKTSVADELWTLQRQLSMAVLANVGAERPPVEAIDIWLTGNHQRLSLYQETLLRLHEAPEVDLAMLSVALEGLRTLLYAAHEQGRPVGPSRG
ncbi:NAD-glutamate dehydrogenase domain-containing protein [Nocardioides sp. AN3]